MNLPERQQYGAQPPLEMLRLLLDRAGLFDRWEGPQNSEIHGCTATRCCMQRAKKIAQSRTSMHVMVGATISLVYGLIVASIRSVQLQRLQRNIVFCS
jgi:hypothetical protein